MFGHFTTCTKGLNTYFGKPSGMVQMFSAIKLSKIWLASRNSLFELSWFSQSLNQSDCLKLFWASSLIALWRRDLLWNISHWMMDFSWSRAFVLIEVFVAYFNMYINFTKVVTLCKSVMGFLVPQTFIVSGIFGTPVNGKCFLKLLIFGYHWKF